VHIKVNGTRLWFDVDGPAPMADGGRMRQRPTVVLVHGGPGVYDHSYFKPDFARLTEHAQVIYLDLRGHGRSEWGDAAGWSFETCAMDAPDRYWPVVTEFITGTAGRELAAT
jgi:proline iminopeptidase